MEFTAYLAWATLLVAFPISVLASVLLRRNWRASPHLQILRERYVVSVATTFMVLFFGVIFVNNDREVPWIGLDATKWITRLTILGVSLIASGGWLLLRRKRRKAERKP